MSARFVAILVLAISATACSKSGGGSADSTSATAQAEAEKIYVQRCAICHGKEGAGDGPSAADLDPKPRNLQDPSWQSSVDDAYIDKIVKLGGPAVGKSATMPPNPDLESNEATLKALRAKVRSLKR